MNWDGSQNLRTKITQTWNVAASTKDKLKYVKLFCIVYRIDTKATARISIACWNVCLNMTEIAASGPAWTRMSICIMLQTKKKQKGFGAQFWATSKISLVNALLFWCELFKCNINNSDFAVFWKILTALAFVCNHMISRWFFSKIYMCSNKGLLNPFYHWPLKLSTKPNIKYSCLIMYHGWCAKSHFVAWNCSWVKKYWKAAFSNLGQTDQLVHKNSVWDWKTNANIIHIIYAIAKVYVFWNACSIH